MDRRLADLLKQFELERLEVNLFRGESRDIGSPQVYGGQVLGQALMAASSTLPPELVVHSLHAYFLRRGDFNLPIVYQVDRSRDGHSFSSRRVIAIQNGQQIFTFSASFQKPEAGFDHQVDMPEVPPPEDLPDWDRPTPEVAASLPEKTRQYLARERPFQMRPVGLLSAIHPVAAHRCSECGFDWLIACPTTRACIVACWPICRTLLCSVRRCVRMRPSWVTAR